MCQATSIMIRMPVNRISILLVSILLPIATQTCLEITKENQGEPFNACSDKNCSTSDCGFWWCGESKGVSPVSTKLYADSGMLELSYSLPNQPKYTKMVAELFVNEVLEGDECRTADIFNITNPLFQRHSSRTVFLKWPSGKDRIYNLTCSENLMVNFSYVYTGCYFIQVWDCIDSSCNRPTKDCPKMYYSNYVKEILTDMPPVISPQYHSVNRTLSVAVSGGGLLSSQKSVVQIVKISNNDDDEDDDVSVNLYCYYSASNRFHCQRKEGSLCYSNCSLMNEKVDGKEVVKCLFNDVAPGNYCINIMYDDDRCHVGSVWANRSCEWGRQLEAHFVKIDNPSPTIEPPSSNLIKLVLVILVLFIMVILYLFWKSYSSASLLKPKDHLTTIKYFVKFGQPSVLLLYPRDCSAFMEAMAHFRRVLKRANCKVYDCWDAHQYNDVVRNPHSWVQLNAVDKSMRVIVVASECSQLLERSVLGSSEVKYRNPETFDDLFLYGVHCLNETTLTDCYEKMFVVRLRGSQDSSEVSSLAYLNPLTVFSLPVHLEKLILALHSVDGSHYSIAMDFPEVLDFQSAIEANSAYKSTNPEYLDSLLRVVHMEEEENLLL